MNTPSRTVNVGNSERLLSIIGGSLLLLDSVFNNRFRMYKAGTGGYLLYRGISGNCPAYALAGKTSWRQFPHINIRTSMQIQRSPASLYHIWRNFENLPQFMTHLISVKEIYENIYEWKANVPGKAIPLHWKTCLVMDIPGEVISWKSLPDSHVENSGKIEFRRNIDNSTDLRVNLTYKPPLGLLGGVASDFLQERLEKIVKEDVNNFKAFAERQLQDAVQGN